MTVRNVLIQEGNADILKYNGLIYSNVTELHWFKEIMEKKKKGKKIGEIKKVTKIQLFFYGLISYKVTKRHINIRHG